MPVCGNAYLLQVCISLLAVIVNVLHHKCCFIPEKRFLPHVCCISNSYRSHYVTLHFPRCLGQSILHTGQVPGFVVLLHNAVCLNHATRAVSAQSQLVQLVATSTDLIALVELQKRIKLSEARRTGRHCVDDEDFHKIPLA